MKVASLLRMILIGACCCGTAPAPRAALAPAEAPSAASTVVDGSLPGAEASGAGARSDPPEAGPAPMSGNPNDDGWCPKLGAADAAHAQGPGQAKALAGRALDALISSMRLEIKRRDVRALARRAANQRATAEERLYAHFLLYRLGDRKALQRFVDEFPVENDPFWRLYYFGHQVELACTDVECMNPQFALACAALDDLPNSREKLFQLAKVMDGGASLDNQLGRVWLLAVAPVETVRLAACMKQTDLLVRSIEETGFPIDKLAPAIAALSSARFGDAAQQAAQARVLSKLQKTKGQLLGSPCGGETNDGR
jgi:hypothetical protein